jgi:hypothetical protein
MNLTVSEKFLILAHHQEKSSYVIPEQMRNAGLIGSILIDLISEERLKIEDGKVTVRHTNTNLPEAHRLILQKIHQSSKKKKVKTWISRFAQGSGKYRKGILVSLERKGILRIEHKRFLFIKYLKTSLVKTSIRNEIIRELREIVFNNKIPDHEYAMMLGLVQACKMHKVICRSKEEVKLSKTKLKKIIESNAIARDVDKVIREMQAAVIASITASSVVTSAGSH